jgi:hypothetical protein
MKRTAVWPAVFLISGLLSPGRLGAQSTTAVADNDTTERCILTIHTDVDSALVVIDGREVGRTPLTLDSLVPGAHRLTIADPDIGNWLTVSVKDSLSLEPGERRRLTYILGRRILINTIPSGASLFIRDSLSGTTPIMLQLDTTKRSSLFILRKEGYREASVRPWESPRGYFTIGLIPEREGNSPGTIGKETVFPAERNPWPLYVSGAASIVSGVAAAYLKMMANDRQTRYLGTNDPELLSARNRFDNWSAVALIITQISFGLFTYFLLSD